MLRLWRLVFNWRRKENRMTAPVEIKVRAFSVINDPDGLRLVFCVDEHRRTIVYVTENMIDLLASEIVRHRLDQTAAA